ncbi:hypothetical protein [Fluviispira multicolorata]|uniref:Uncharacterized protein n=1 Tax=Fluviispira multicolorata TaxID=2654512 RepID=A0A833JA95_9BACT|nr:hypothetical protein [Fluviispira multicolorata]KAB8027426.1 hypothetical protein GCL57_14615 [Fluviispira multicolorata]
MSFDLQKHNVAVHASRLNPEFRKAIQVESGVSHLKRNKSSQQMRASQFGEEQTLCVKEETTSLISDSRIYALKKRLLAPMWWVEGILLSLGAKEAWFDSLVSKRAGRIIAAPANVNAKNITLMFAIWHEALSRIFTLQNEESNLRFQINKYLVGTQKDVYEACKQLETIWSTPLKLFEIKASKKSKSLALSKAGSLGFIRHAQIENDVDGIWLTLSLSQTFRDFYSPQEISIDNSYSRPAFVSINPVVIQSMGRKASVKKILNYLFLEFSKQNLIDEQSNWNSIHIDSKNICSFHKEILLNVPALYDHGILGWSIAAPNVKLSELKQKICEQSSETNNSLGSIVYCWHLSEQAKEAQDLEQALGEKLMFTAPQTIAFKTDVTLIKKRKTLQKSAINSTLFPEPPADQLKQARIERALKITKVTKTVKVPKIEKPQVEIIDIPLKKVVKKIIPQTLFDNNISNRVEKTETKVLLKKKLTSTKVTLSDNDFIILVSEFYESLKPLQKKAFERERAGMTPDQFRAYMTPILQRKKPAKLKK